MEEVRTVTGSLDTLEGKGTRVGGWGGVGVRSTLPDSVTVNTN